MDIGLNCKAHDKVNNLKDCKFLYNMLFGTKSMKRKLINKFLRSKTWFTILYRLLKNSSINFIDFGYEYIDSKVVGIELDPADEPDRLFIQLYNAVINSVDLEKKKVIDIGCGRGGGVVFIKRYKKPKSIVGVDNICEAIKSCTQRYADDSVSFFVRDAGNLQFEDDSFDIVVNVESSYCYKNFEAFLLETKRVLRPGGFLLFADFRREDCIDKLERNILNSGFVIRDKEDISENVQKAMNVDNVRRVKLAEKIAPWMLRLLSRQFVGAKKSWIYQMLKSGKSRYLRYVCYNNKQKIFILDGQLFL